MPTKQKQINDYKRIRNAIFELLGKECKWCGFNDIRALQIDHVNGGGSTERWKKRKNGRSGYKYIFDQVVSGSKDYQILCANCNWIKRYINKERIK